MLIYCIVITLVAVAALLFALCLCIDVSSCEKQLSYIRREGSSIRLSHFFFFLPLRRILRHFEELRLENRTIQRDYQMQEQRTKELITNISHDIRTPLTSISGYIEMLDGASLKERERYLHIIGERLSDMEELLDTFFLYARLQMDQGERIPCEKQPLYPMLCESVLSYYEQLQEAGLTPQISCVEEEIQAWVNEGALKRVFQNLIVNVIRYGKNPFTISLYAKGSEAICVFSNAMIGEVDVDQLFTRFYQGDGARGAKGSGLGMAIVKELCDQMQVAVQADQAEGRLSIVLRMRAQEMAGSGAESA